VTGSARPPAPPAPRRAPDPDPATPGPAPETEPTATRIWHGFMTARVVVALALLLLEGTVSRPGVPPGSWLLSLCLAYLMACLATRLLLRPPRRTPVQGAHWTVTVGIDLLGFSAMQLLHPGAINYMPLLAVPVLMVAALGSRVAALGTAASVTLLLLAHAWWLGTQGPDNAAAAQFLQAGLAGTGYFLVALLVHQLAARLAREEHSAQRSRQATVLQARINDLVIETLTEGVLVVDAHGRVQAANPSARRLLGSAAVPAMLPFALADRPGWHALDALARHTFDGAAPQVAQVALHPHDDPTGPGLRRLRVRTRLTAGRAAPAPPSDGADDADRPGADGVCVMFLHDLREMEARLRNDKLAAMGRMSAAVAHEIRNPLAAIAQANALLAEDLRDPMQQQLCGMVAHNARRLARIAEEVLDIARVQRQLATGPATTLALDDAVAACCREWQAVAAAPRRPGAAVPTLRLGTPGLQVEFDPDHLRRVLVNLLDNALRHIGPEADALQVATRQSPAGQALLEVWSDGPPLEQAVEQHLFEPFFSSESRSSGLGLYICRELCERHRATLGYQRVGRTATRGGQPREVPGNAFAIAFRPPPGSAHAPLFDDTIVV